MRRVLGKEKACMILVCTTVAAGLVVGCSKHGDVRNGGLSMPNAGAVAPGAASADKRAQSGTLTHYGLPMGYGVSGPLNELWRPQRSKSASSQGGVPVSASVYQQLQHNPQAAAQFATKAGLKAK